MVMNTRWITWTDPFGPSSEPVYCRVSRDTAIATAKAFAAKSGKTYANDEQALEDFITTHWAQREDDDNVCDACAGTGTPVSGLPCMCRGTGKMSEAARFLREQIGAEFFKQCMSQVDWKPIATAPRDGSFIIGGLIDNTGEVRRVHLVSYTDPVGWHERGSGKGCSFLTHYITTPGRITW